MSNLPPGLNWEKAPKNRKYFYYSVAFITPLLSESDFIRLSRNTVIRKIRTIKSKQGRSLVGKDSIDASVKLTNEQWNKPEFANNEGSHYIFMAFSHLFPSHNWAPESYGRRYEQADSVIEVSFRDSESITYNEMQDIALRETRRVVTALRLIHLSGLRIIGPVAIIKHPSVGDGLSGPNINDVAAITRLTSTLLLNRKSARSLKTLFKTLGRTLPNQINLALRRFELSLTRQSAEDQIIDAVIGLEALFLTDNSSDLRYRLALRATIQQNLGETAREEFFEKMLFLYDTRSRLIHGSLSELKGHKKIGRHPFKAESDIVNFARATLQTSLRTVLESIAHGCDWHNYHRALDSSAIKGTRFNPPSKP